MYNEHLLINLNEISMMTTKQLFFNYKFYFETIETTFNSDKIICFMKRFLEQTVKKRL